DVAEGVGERRRDRLAQPGRALAAAHGEGEGRCDRIRVCHAELVVDARRATLPLERAGDTREVEAALPPAKGRASTVGDEHDRTGLDLGHVPTLSRSRDHATDALIPLWAEAC